MLQSFMIDQQPEPTESTEERMPTKRRKHRFPFLNPLGLRKQAPVSPSNRHLPKSSATLASTKKYRPWQKEWWREWWKRRKERFSWKKLFIGIGVVFGLVVILISGAFAYYVRDLPNPKIIADRQIDQSTQILDRNGTVLYDFYGDQNRQVVTGDQISTPLKQATIAVEDAEFYSHHGFSVKGISRAVLGQLHLLPASEMAGGGSTITQQYIKNALLSNKQTPDRKLRELILAIEVERIYSKDEILTGYLNEIPYGSNAYGIQAAARTYFGKDAKDLNLSESAILAAIPNAPTYYSPYGNNLDALFARKDYILDRMASVGFITQTQADQAKKEAPTLDNPAFQHNSNLTAPHFVFYVRQKLIEYLENTQGLTPQEAETQLDQAGYKVTTSLDLPTQKMGEKVLADMGPWVVKNYNASNAALTAVDPKTGEVIAMVGSIDYSTSKSGNTNFATALLQPGSTMKPIVYATAFGPDYHYAPGSITYDLQTNFGTDATPYKPNNYNGKFNGPITDRNALAGSLNIPAVKNLSLVGIPAALKTAEKLGVTTLDTEHPEKYGLSLVLGSGEVQGVEMASAYGTFANGGMHNPLRPILKIEKNGQLVKDFRTDQAVKVLEPETAYEINNVLSDYNAKVPIFGSLAKNLTLSDRPVAAKTGTTENNKDGWTIGYTPQLVTAVWVGNNEANKVMSKGADGSVVAAPIWNRFMKQYFQGKQVEQFTRPDTVKDVTIDKLSGKLPTDQTPDNDKITDIFAPWQMPKDPDDVHVKVKIDQASGKLATDLTPAGQIVEQTFFTVHSERPDNPNWENPVQAWAKQNGGGISPPTASDDLHTDANRPTITITSPANGSTVNGTFTITAGVGGARTITRVEFFLNNVSIGVATTAPWSITYDSKNLQAGSQIIQAIATNDIQLTQSTQVTVTTAQDTTPPDNVTGLTANLDNSKALNRPIHLNWVNPSNTDLASLNVYISTDPASGAGANPGNLITPLHAPDATPNATTGVDIDVSALQAGKTYYFSVRPVDGSGNENQSAQKVPVKVEP